MSTDRSKSRLEALLFVSDEPVSAEDLAEILEIDVESIETDLEELAAEYEQQQRGFQLREIAGGWRLYSNPLHHELVEQYVLSWDTRKLSQAALEALAVIAYRQPVTRAGINAVRGVNSEAVIGSLLEKGLIRDVGRDRMGGNAILYGTTLRFLEKFGLTSLEDLPDIEQFKPVQDVADSIRERLDSTLPATNDQIETLEEDETHEDNDNNYDDDELHETDH